MSNTLHCVPGKICWCVRGPAAATPASVWSVGNHMGVIIHSFNGNVSKSVICCAWVWYCYVTKVYAYDFAIKDSVIRQGHYLCQTLYIYIFFSFLPPPPPGISALKQHQRDVEAGNQYLSASSSKPGLRCCSLLVRLQPLHRKHLRTRGSLGTR